MQQISELRRDVNKRIQLYVTMLMLVGIFCTFFPLTTIKAATSPLKRSINFSWNKSDLSEITWEYETPADGGYQAKIATFHYNSKISSDKIDYTVAAVNKPSTAIMFKTYSTSALVMDTYNLFWGRNYEGYAMLIVGENDNQVYGAIANTNISTNVSNATDNLKYVIFPPAPLDNPDAYGSKNEIRSGLATLSLINNNMGPYPIKAKGDETTKEGLCQNIEEDWITLKTMIRSMMIPAPGSTAGASKNDNWVVYDTGAAHTGNIITAPVRDKIMSMFGVTGFKIDNMFQIDILDLSNEGVVTLNNISTKSAELKSEIETLKTMSSNVDTISVSCGSDCHLKPMKWDDALESGAADLVNFSDLSENIAKTTAFADKYIGVLDDPGASAGGACGSATSVGEAILVGFCNVTVMAKEWAMSLFCFAQNKLEEVLGQQDVTSSKCTESKYNDDPTMKKIIK